MNYYMERKKNKLTLKKQIERKKERKKEREKERKKEREIWIRGKSKNKSKKWIKINI